MVASPGLEDEALLAHPCLNRSQTGDRRLDQLAVRARPPESSIHFELRCDAGRRRAGDPRGDFAFEPLFFGGGANAGAAVMARLLGHRRRDEFAARVAYLPP